MMLHWMLFTSLSFTLAGGYVLVPAWINERGPYLMLVDTGATSSAVTPEVAREAGLRPAYRLTLAAAGGEMTVAAVPDTRIRVGETAGAGAETLILPLDAIRRIDPRIRGVLGQSFLAHVPCLIDYRDRRIWLGSEAVIRAGQLPLMAGVQSAAGRMTVPASLGPGTSPVRLVVDTGASDMTLRAGVIHGNAGAWLVSNTGERLVRRGVVEAVDVGGIRIRQAHVALLEGAALSENEDGVLPGRWFSAIYLDAARNEIRLAR
jgi:predicted aspartyl protease